MDTRRDRDRIDRIARKIRDVPDFPKPGILFKDITPVVSDPQTFADTIDLLHGRYASRRIGAVVAIEARGFIFGGPLAARLGCGMALVRKAGKLPYESDRVTYALEYGEGTLEMHVDALAKGQRVVIVDDLLATGGTAKAAAELCARRGAEVAEYAFLVELSFLGGRDRLAPIPVHGLVTF
jgi:adenine phosphoribosyltransferase